MAFAVIEEYGVAEPVKVFADTPDGQAEFRGWHIELSVGDSLRIDAVPYNESDEAAWARARESIADDIAAMDGNGLGAVKFVTDAVKRAKARGADMRLLFRRLARATLPRPRRRGERQNRDR